MAAAAGELARRVLVLPWREGEAEDAATIFEAWREALGGDGPGELREALGRSARRPNATARAASAASTCSSRATHLTARRISRTHSDQLGFRFVEEHELVWGFTAAG